jgi:hypothetical protein
MTAVRNGARDEPGKVTDRSDVRPPTDVMAITSLPDAGYVVTRSRPYLET